jgi:hypothetical protein
MSIADTVYATASHHSMVAHGVTIKKVEWIYGTKKTTEKKELHNTQSWYGYEEVL